MIRQDEGSPSVGVPSRAGRISGEFARLRRANRLWVGYLKLLSCCANLARTECAAQSVTLQLFFAKFCFVSDAAKREAKAPPTLPSNVGEKALALQQGLRSVEALQAFSLPATLLEWFWHRTVKHMQQQQ